jgi:hypothetical protein
MFFLNSTNKQYTHERCPKNKRTPAMFCNSLFAFSGIGNMGYAGTHYTNVKREAGGVKRRTS